MDVLFFFKERTRFIRYFYETAGMPFYETMRKIEAEEAPFDDPPYSEDGEPPYTEEWIEASEAVEVLGRTCLSMLSTSIQLYFRVWMKQLGIRFESEEDRHSFRNGFLQGYKTCLEGDLGISWACCPADLELIEQIILARNRDQHPAEITTMNVRHGKKDLKKYSLPFFMSEFERKEFNAMAGKSFMTPTVYVSREMLCQAVDETEKMTDWLEEHLLNVLYKRKTS